MVASIDRVVGICPYMKYAKIFTKTMTEEAYMVYVFPTGRYSITLLMQAKETITKQMVRRIGIISVNPCVFFTYVLARDPAIIVPIK